MKSKQIMTKRFCLVFGIVFIVSSGVCAFGQGKDPNAAEVLRHYRESLSWLQSVSMRVNIKTSQVGRIEAGVSSPSREYHFVHRRDGNRCEWIGESVLLDSQGNIDFESSTVFKSIFDDGQYVEVLGPIDEPPFIAQISKDFEGERELLCDAPSRAGALNGNIFGNNHKNIAELLTDSNDLRLRDKQEYINGAACYVLEATTKYGKVTAWVAPEKGYSALRWVVEKSPRDLFDATLFSAMWSETESWEAMLESVDLQKIDDVFVPATGHFVHTIQKKDGRVIANHFRYECSEVKLNPDFEAIGAFKIDLPDGTRVFMEESPGIRYVWRDGKAVPDVDEPTFEEIDKTISELKK